MNQEIHFSLNRRQARSTSKSMEFMRRNLECIAGYLPKNRRVRDIYRQLLYDSYVIFGNLHDRIEEACVNAESSGSFQQRL